MNLAAKCWAVTMAQQNDVKLSLLDTDEYSTLLFSEFWRQQ